MILLIVLLYAYCFLLEFVYYGNSVLVVVDAIAVCVLCFVLLLYCSYFVWMLLIWVKICFLVGWFGNVEVLVVFACAIACMYNSIVRFVYFFVYVD